MRINLLTLAIFAMALVVGAPHLHRIFWTPVRITGAALALVSFAVIVIARFQLGSAFSVKAKAQKLVTTGVFVKIRNPIYVFGEIFLLGVVLLSGRWWILIVAAAIIPIQAWRARNEARVLREKFGEEYERYRAQTWF